VPLNALLELVQEPVLLQYLVLSHLQIPVVSLGSHSSQQSCLVALQMEQPVLLPEHAQLSARHLAQDIVHALSRNRVFRITYAHNTQLKVNVFQMLVNSADHAHGMEHVPQLPAQSLPHR
jgi:uncharacterized lipoprotein YajG